MSFYITLLSDQAQGTGQKFKARLPRSYYLVEDDWEVVLVHISHPGLYQPLEDETKQNWTQEDSLLASPLGHDPFGSCLRQLYPPRL